MKPAAFSPRFCFIATVMTILTFAVTGWALWSLSAAQYRRVIDGWIDQGRQAGYEISYDDRQLFGFPRHIVMRLVNLRWKNADGIDFRTDDMDIDVTPWNWNRFEAKFKNHVVLAAPLDNDGHALLLSTGQGTAEVKLDDDGIWKKAQLSLRDATVGLSPDYLFGAARLSASVERPETAPRDHHEPGLTLTGEARDIAVPSAMPSLFGDKAASFAVKMRVMGPVPDVRLRSSVDVWNKDSGVVEFDTFALQWGKLDLAAKGTLGFDDDLQPEGAFAGTVAKPQETIRTLVDSGFIAMHDKDMLDSVMSMLAKPSDHGGKGMELPVTVQLGGLFFGPIRIFTFPQIDWPTEKLTAPAPLPALPAVVTSPSPPDNGQGAPDAKPAP
jgi:hypothetical protein